MALGRRGARIRPGLAAALALGADDLGPLTRVFRLAFAGTRPVLGVLLDRFGPHRVESALLLVAALAGYVVSRPRRGRVFGDGCTRVS